MKAYVRCTLTTADGQTAFQGHGATEQEALAKAMAVIRRKLPRSKESDFKKEFVQFGTPIPSKLEFKRGRA